VDGKDRTVCSRETGGTEEVKKTYRFRLKPVRRLTTGFSFFKNRGGTGVAMYNFTESFITTAEIILNRPERIVTFFRRGGYRSAAKALYPQNSESRTSPRIQ
jgi:hypothetical protein